MEHRLRQYPLLLAVLALLLVITLLGAPFLGLALILIGGYLLYRENPAPQSIVDGLSGWLIRNRYVLTSAVILAIVSGFVPISASPFPLSKLYGFPSAFVTYHLPADESSALIPPLSSLSVSVPEFFVDIIFYFLLLWVTRATWRRKIRAT